MEKLISIIIPVFNVEGYLDRCIKSILGQIREQTIEVLLIDDGSTDSSGEICDKYASLYTNILVIHKRNGGLSDARNCGILKACGKYLLFLDSDDQINENALEEIKIAMDSDNNFDIYIGRYISVYEKSLKECNYILNPDLKSLKGEVFLSALLDGVEHYDWYACLNIIKREFLISNNFFFTKSRYFEDALWTPLVLYSASKISVFNYPFYLYTREREGAITCSFTKNIYRDKLNVCRFFKNLCRDNCFNEKTTKLLNGNLNLIYNSLLADYWRCDWKDRSAYWFEVKSYSNILKDSKRRVDKLLHILHFLIGLRGISLLLYFRTKLLRVFK